MQGMREVLRSSLGRSLKTLPEEDRLVTAWPLAAGAALAARAEIVGYQDGEVLVLVSGEEWMEPLSQMRLVLASELGRIAGVPVTALHLKTRR